jgi:DNA-binding transcriptional ArsR family regulator
MNLREISSIVGISRESAEYHASKLHSLELLDRLQVGKKRYYAVRSLRDIKVTKALITLYLSPTKKIFEFISANSGSYQNLIATTMNMNHQTIKHHLDKLLEVNLINKISETSKQQRKVKYEVSMLGKSLYRPIDKEDYLKKLNTILQSHKVEDQKIVEENTHMEISISNNKFQDVYRINLTLV